MNVVLWIVAGLLVVVYLAAGAMKLATRREKLLANPNMGWAANFSEVAVKGIGAAEILAALGLVLPWALGVAAVLTPLAATGLVVLQAGAILVHVKRKEAKVLPVNVVLLVLAAFVAIGRFAGLIPPIATAEQLAASITFLLSDDGVNVNGAVLPSDGGWSAQ